MHSHLSCHLPTPHLFPPAALANFFWPLYSNRLKEKLALSCTLQCLLLRKRTSSSTTTNLDRTTIIGFFFSSLPQIQSRPLDALSHRSCTKLQCDAMPVATVNLFFLSKNSGSEGDRAVGSGILRAPAYPLISLLYPVEVLRRAILRPCH